MSQKMGSTLRVGIISFVNALPFFEHLHELLKNEDIEFIYSTPKAINTQLAEGTLDTALISTASYLEHREHYILLSDLGISSDGKVHSVKLFYKNKLSLPIYVPEYSESSIALLKILCEHVWKVPAHFEPTATPSAELMAKAASFLAIGDACLQIEPLNKYSSYDLGAVWKEWTGLPFVYALFATRATALREKMPLLRKLYSSLDAHFRMFESDPHGTIRKAVAITGCTPRSIARYYKALQYRLYEPHFMGIERYRSYLCPK